MAWIFEVEDITKRMIRLTEKGWSHIQKYHNAVSQIERIKETLIHPHTLRIDEVDTTVMQYYRYDKQKKQYLFISVKYLNGEGFIITSFYTNKIQ